MGKLTNGVNLLHVALAMAVSGVLVMGAMDSAKMLHDKSGVQQSNTNLLQRWKDSYLSLKTSIAQWQGSYMSTKDVPDIDAVGALIDPEKYGLIVNLDKLKVISAKPVDAAGLGLDLTKLCLGSGGDYLAVSAKNYPVLLDGLAQLSKRPDIYIGSIAIGGEGTTTQARLTNFCVYLRND
jgi:hypothetical protein